MYNGLSKGIFGLKIPVRPFLFPLSNSIGGVAASLQCSSRCVERIEGMEKVETRRYVNSAGLQGSGTLLITAN